MLKMGHFGIRTASIFLIIHTTLLSSGIFCLDRNADIVQDLCNLPAETGFCYAYFPSFYYDIQADMCKPFVYGGCGGNANRFETELECRKFRQRCLRKLGKQKRG